MTLLTVTYHIMFHFLLTFLPLNPIFHSPYIYLVNTTSYKHYKMLSWIPTRLWYRYQNNPNDMTLLIVTYHIMFHFFVFYSLSCPLIMYSTLHIYLVNTAIQHYKMLSWLPTRLWYRCQK